MRLFNKGKSKITFRDSSDPAHVAPHKTGELIRESLPGQTFDASDKTGAYLKKLYPMTLQSLEDAKKAFSEDPPKATAAPAAPAAAVAPITEDLKLEAETRGMSIDELLAEEDVKKGSKKAK